MKILVIGSEGFIGKSCINFFHELGNTIYGCDLLDLKEVNYPYHKISRMSPGFDDIFLKGQFDVCVNAAGSGSVPLSITNPYADFESNTLDTFKVLESIRIHNPKCKYLNISSAAVYGNPQKLPINERDEVLPLSPYGWHKYYSELVCKEYSSLYGIQTCSVRPFSVYGPGLKKQLFWDIFQKTLATKDVTLSGTGLESRDFIYISDLVACISLILNNGLIKGEIYNIASGEETTIKTASSTFVEYIDPNIKISFNQQQRAGDPINWKADIESLINIGFTPKVNLNSGLQKYAQWLKEKI